MSSMIVKISSNFLKNQLKNKYLVWQQLVMKSVLIGIPTEQDQAKYNGNRKKPIKGSPHLYHLHVNQYIQ